MDPSLDLKNVNLYLIGIEGVDKTSPGQHLAQHLQYQFMHTDALLQQLAPTDGPAASTLTPPEHDLLESQILAQVAAYTRLVVATGAGIVQKPGNWGHLQQGIVVWLDLPVQDILAQHPQAIDAGSRLELEQQMQACRHLYAQADVHLVLKPDWSAAHITEQLCLAVAKVIKTDESSL